jgi:hypothetical protein
LHGQALAASFLPAKSSAGQQPISPLSHEPVRLCFAVRRALSTRLILSPGTGAEAGAATASATRPRSVIRRVPTIWFLDRAASVVSANPTRTRLSIISPEKPCAVISALVAPTRLDNISSARRHWGLRNISRLTQAAPDNPPLWRQLPVKRNCTEVRLNPNSNHSFVRCGGGIAYGEQQRDDKLANQDQNAAGFWRKGARTAQSACPYHGHLVGRAQVPSKASVQKIFVLYYTKRSRRGLATPWRAF